MGAVRGGWVGGIPQQGSQWAFELRLGMGIVGGAMRASKASGT